MATSDVRDFQSQADDHSEEKGIAVEPSPKPGFDTYVNEVHYVNKPNGGRLAYGPTPDEVKAVAVETDDVDEPCESIRAYFLGTIITIVGTGVNTWFGARQPGVYLSPFLAQVISHPMGVALAKVLPAKTFTVFGQRVSLNPGPWTIKEHCIVTLMATVSFPTATAIDIILAIRQPVFFNDPALGGNLGFQFLIILSTQFLGFGLAGLVREYLVYPSSMIWPLNLAKVSLFNALHRRKVNEAGVVIDQEVHGIHHGDKEADPPVNGWKISSFRFMVYTIIASFCWFWVTDFLAPCFLYFNWPTWIAPNNVKLAVIMGSITGLGLNPLPTLDWSYISGAGLTPLITPWWATVNILIGAIIGFVIIVAMYFSNTWYTSYLLVNSNAAFDRFGLSYNVTRVLTAEMTFDEAAYLEYSPLYFSAGFNLLFGAYAASYSAALVYALLNHWKQIKMGVSIGVRQLKSLYTKVPEDHVEDRPDLDIHYALARQYKETPQWWFGLITLISLVFGIIACEIYHTTMPVWGIFACFALALVFLIPGGIIMALSNVTVSLVVLAEIIPGVALPGKPYANMIFKIYGWIALVMALLYVQDQKLAHYLHVPPRATFRAQMWGCLVGSLITLGTIDWQMKAVPDLCEVGQKDLLTCPYQTTFYSSALMYGVVGPTRMYGSHGLYHNLMWAFFVGAALTALVWAVKRKWPNKYTNRINVPVIISGAQYYAPYNFSFIWAGIPLAWTFMSYIHGRFPGWWNKYCYLLSIGLTVGVAISAVIQYFAITFPGVSISWWGNTFYATGCDALGCALKEMPEVGYFGPAPGDFQ